MLKAVPESVFAWVVRRERSAQQRLQQAALRKAQARAYQAFARERPTWADSLFDEYFLAHAAAPLLQRCLQPGTRPTAIELAAAWYAQLSYTGREPRAFSEAIAAAARFLALLDGELWPYRAAGPLAEPATLPPYAGAAEGLFAEALRDPSNLELDWLWLARQVSRASGRRYCLERALAINPQSETARRMLAD
jgi:hypothetical protein